MRRYIFLWFCLLWTVVAASQLPKEYNIVWTTQSNNASESMPCGGGDIGLNVWVEKGELLIYAAKSGFFNEDNALMKAGRIRIKLLPNPFDGNIFKQELHLQEGYVTVDGENKGVKATVEIWVDVHAPIVSITIGSNKDISVEASYESWRYKERSIAKRENFGNSWKWTPPKEKKYSADEISFSTGGVLFYHNNGGKTIFDTIVTQQGMNSVKEQLYNPIKNLAFGGLFCGRNFIEAGTYEDVYAQTDFKGWKLKSKKPARGHGLELILHNEQVSSFSQWHQSLKRLLMLSGDKNVFNRLSGWWENFWQRSFIYINKSDTTSQAWKVARNYQLFRYMLACNSNSQWPTKFNGGLFTVDPIFTDTVNKGLTPDYRNWGGGLHTAQNQRLVYFPMIKSGDWDLLQPQLNFYLRLLKNAELRSKVYWDHGGACFTEQMENFGLPNYAEYGTKRPPDFDKGVEYNAWLEYQWDTVLEFCLMMLEENRYTGKHISDERLVFMESCLRFFEEHYVYLAKQRGQKAYDVDGKLSFYPGSSAETYKKATDATSTLAGLSVVSERLSNYILKYVFNNHSCLGRDTASENRMKIRDYVNSFQVSLPPLSYQQFNGHTTIAPAKSWERINNTESPQLYPVFPWRIYGVGKPGLDTALNTWRYDTNVIKFRSHVGWKQDNIWAAGLGLTEEAWRLTSLKLQNSGRRFPAFWGPGYDWVPDHNWGGSGMIGLQDMLLQTDDKRILLFPAWPKDKDVHFKLHASYNTTVEAELKNGKIVSLKVLPEDRKKDVEVLLR